MVHMQVWKVEAAATQTRKRRSLAKGRFPSRGSTTGRRTKLRPAPATKCRAVTKAIWQREHG